MPLEGECVTTPAEVLVVVPPRFQIGALHASTGTASNPSVRAGFLVSGSAAGLELVA